LKPTILAFYEPESFTWSYLLADETAGKAAIIDPVWVYDPVTGTADTAFVEQILAAADERGWTIEWILETHAHADHLSAGDFLRGKTGAGLAIGRGISDVQANFARVYNLPGLAADGSEFDRLLAEGDELTLGGLKIRVMETPGHTGDSVTYLVGDVAFVGDTLFAPAYGTARCDFPGGDAHQLYRSIGRLHALPDNTRLMLCHDYPEDDTPPRSEVSVRESRESNVHLAGGVSEAEFVAMREARDATLGLPRLLLPSLQVNILGGAAPAPESNGASYLKIPFNTTIPDLLGGSE
jgi:glyoxylase-like metal-dependent hydrolase (beta-lactamase superfamily II)